MFLSRAEFSEPIVQIVHSQIVFIYVPLNISPDQKDNQARCRCARRRKQLKEAAITRTCSTERNVA
jgi:hypothetical protein